MIGERLKDIRKDKGYNQEEFARLLNVSRFTVRSWETENSAPSHELLVQICRLLKVSADFLLGLTDDDPLLHPQSKDTLSPEYRTMLRHFEQFLLSEQKKSTEKENR